MDMLTRMETARFKVRRSLSAWFEEFRLYHRKDGKIVKERDDLMAATRYEISLSSVIFFGRDLSFTASVSAGLDFFFAML